MARYYRRRRIYRKKNRWNIEQRVSNSGATVWQNGQGTGAFNKQLLFPVVPSSDTEGVRKVKNISISACLMSESFNSGSTPIYWALIYAPEGVAIGELQRTGELYQPSQYVINSGILSSQLNTSNHYRISSRLARNLRANDRIYLLLGTQLYVPTNTNASAPGVSWLCRYAICYN